MYRNPPPGRYPDSWKRRGQARSALGDMDGALSDLAKCAELLPLFEGQSAPQSQADCLCERGMIYQKQRNYRKACKELKRAVELDPNNVQVSTQYCIHKHVCTSMYTCKYV